MGEEDPDEVESCFGGDSESNVGEGGRLHLDASQSFFSFLGSRSSKGRCGQFGGGLGTLETPKVEPFAAVNSRSLSHPTKCTVISVTAAQWWCQQLCTVEPIEKE